MQEKQKELEESIKEEKISEKEYQLLQKRLLNSIKKSPIKKLKEKSK